MDGPPPQEEDFSALSVEDRLGHKNWKARVSGYEALARAFALTASDADPAFRPYLAAPDILKRAVTDANVAAQEKGVDAAVAFVRFAGENAARTREVLVPALVDKCLGSARASIKAVAIELVCQYVEVENGGAGVVENLLPGLAAKQPKVVAGTVTALKEVVRQFGIQVTPPPPILKALPKIFAHTDKTVRAEGSSLTHSLYQYLGAGIEPWLADLKPVQVKELKEAWEAMEKDGQGKGSLKPARFTRKQAREMEESAGAADADEAPAEEDLAPLDPRQFAEPVDIVPKLPPSMQAGLASSKWKERKEVLDDLLALLSATPRIVPAPEFGELSKSLATCVQKDANINCVMVAAQCLEGLAKGLQDAFARYHEAVLPPMLERLKERKATVTDTIGVALDAIFLTVSLAEVIEDIKPTFTHKNPQVKEGVLKFLTRSLATSKQPIPPAQVKPVSEALAVLLEDGFAGARDEAANALGTLMKMVGERPLGPVMEGLADVRKAKVKEAFEKATVKAKAGGAAPRAAPPPAAAPPKPAPKKAPPKKAEPPPPAREPSPPPPATEEEPMAPPKRAPPARFLQKKAPAAAAPDAPAPAAPPPATGPSVKKLPPAAAAKGAKPPPPAAPGQLDTFKFKHTPEDSEALAAEIVPGSIGAQFHDANWKTRLLALDEATTWVEAEAEGLDAEVVVRFFAKKGWSEKNFQVSAKLYGLLMLLADNCPSFGRSCVALSVPHMTEKLGDAKLKKPAGDAMLLFAEKTSLQFVLNQSYDALGKIKAPKAQADALSWIESALREFGIAGLSLRALIEVLKTSLGNSNAAVRTSATKTLVTLKLFAGAGIKDLLGDINPQLLATIQSEFDKADGQAPPEPTRSSADVAAMAPAAGAAGKGGAGAVDALDDLFPRVEFDSLLKGTTILADSKSDAWKTKKEALETLQAILDQGPNKRLKPNIGDMVQVLKARVVDSNKAVQNLALDIVARIAAGMGKPFEKQTKFFVVPVASVTSDQKAPTRAAGIATLAAIADACEGMEPLVAGLTTALEVNNPVQRATLLAWLVGWFTDPEHAVSKSLDLSGWVAPIVGSLDDRSGDVRKSAAAMLPFLIASVGFDKVLAQTNSLKPASKTSAMPIINAARASAPSAAPAAPAPEAAKAPAAAKAPSKPAAAKLAPPPVVEEPPPPSPAAKPIPGKLGVRNMLRAVVPSRPESRSGTDVEDGPAPTSARLAKPGLKRPAGLAAATAKAAPSPAPSPPVTAGGGALLLTNMNAGAKAARLAKDGTRWVNEGGATRKDLAELLQHQMEPHGAPELLGALFSHDHSAVGDHVAGMGMLCDFYGELAAGGEGLGLSGEEARALGLANSDFALKYASMKAHESQSNLVNRCLDVVDAVLAFMHGVTYELSDAEATCFVPTMVFKLGDARENTRQRVQAIFAALPKVYPYSQVFQTILDHGLKSKVAKCRQFSLEELEKILKRSGMRAMESPSKTCPAIALMIADKDPSVRKGALAVLSEVYTVEGERVWSLVGPLSPKDKTQLEERLRRVSGPSTPPKSASAVPAAQISRLATGIGRPASPSGLSTRSALPRPDSPAGASRLARPMSPSKTVGIPSASGIARPQSHLPGPASPTTAAGRGRGSLLPSRLGPPKSRLSMIKPQIGRPRAASRPEPEEHEHLHDAPASAGSVESWRNRGEPPEEPDAPSVPSGDITLTISSVLSSDSDRSVDALKKVQKILQLGPEEGPSSPEYRDLAEHAEGLVETITLQMNHAFDHPERRVRLAKHLIQTLNAFCDNPLLAESLTVDILTALLEELAMRLLQTDDSANSEVKNLSRFINMIMLRIFSTGRRITVFRALFALLLQIVRPFPSHGTQADSQEARVAELVLKCIWKLARNIPQDLEQAKLDPVELFPAIEHFLQSVPPNEWRARSANRVPCGDMPLRTIKVIIQHVVAHYADEVYDILSTSFEDPSATIVYPYVYRILNASAKAESNGLPRNGSNGLGNGAAHHQRQLSENVGTRMVSPTATSRADTPTESASVVSADQEARRHSRSPSRRTQSVVSANGGQSAEEPDPDAEMDVIFGHISSSTTGALHKEGITELHQFLKQYPHKKAKVDAYLEGTGVVFRKYITRALATRAAEDEERNVAVADTLSRLESNSGPISPGPTAASAPQSPARSRFDSGAELSRSPMSSTFANGSDHGSGGAGAGAAAGDKQEKLHRLHDIFRYRSSTASSVTGGRATPSLNPARPQP